MSVNPSPLLPLRREVLVVHIIFCLRNILHKIGQPPMNKVESGRNRYYSCFSTSLVIRYMIMYYSYHSLNWGVTLLHTLKKTFRSLVSFSFRNQFLLYNRGWLSRQVYDSCTYFHQISKCVKNVAVARTRSTGNRIGFNKWSPETHGQIHINHYDGCYLVFMLMSEGAKIFKK